MQNKIRREKEDGKPMGFFFPENRTHRIVIKEICRISLISILLKGKMVHVSSQGFWSTGVGPLALQAAVKQCVMANTRIRSTDWSRLLTTWQPGSGH